MKTISVAVLAFVAHELLYVLGVMFTAMRDALPENTIGKLAQEGIMSGLAAYLVLYAANAWFSNLRLRVLVVTFLLLVVSVNGFLVFFVSRLHEIGPRSPAVTSAVVAIVGAAIAAFIFLRREHPTRRSGNDA